MIDFNQILNTVYVIFGILGISIALIVLLAERKWFMIDFNQVISSDYTAAALLIIFIILVILVARKGWGKNHDIFSSS